MNTLAGGRTVVATMTRKFGSYEAYVAHQRAIGAKGGKVRCRSGFASDKVGKDGLTGYERARIAGVKGGRNGTRAGIPNRRKEFNK